MIVLRKLATLFIVFLCAYLSYGQELIIEIVDEKDLPLPGVLLYSSSEEITYISDNKGLVTIICPCTDSIFYTQFLGYETLDFHLSEIEQQPHVLQLEASREILEEILIIGRTDAHLRDLPFLTEAIKQEQIKSTQSQTTADALASHSGVFVQKSQMGGGSPVLRGFEANKLLLVVDGVRMNNAIYRSGHLQNAITIDPSIITQTEVLYGPASIMYGSDALGGVIHFRTQTPKWNSSKETQLSGAYSLRHAAANDEKSGHFHINLGVDKLSSLTSISYADFGDMRAGSNRPDKYPMFGQRTTYVDPATDEIKINDDPDVQIGTAYSQLDVLQKLTYSINDTWQLTANFQYSTSSDIPRYDQLSVMDATGEFEYSEWHYGPQRRMLGSLRADFHGYSRLFDQSQFILAYQRINEDRVTRVFRNPLRREQNERVDVMTFNADFTKYLDPNKQHALMYGLEGHYNHVNSEAFGTDITSGEKNIPILSRYPSDGSNMLDGGIYALWVWKLDGWTLQSGSRISWHKLEVRYDENDVFNWPTYFYEGIDQSNTSFTWMAGLRKAWKSGTRMRMSGGTAFRAPNVDDFAKVRIKSNNISIPNPNLGPEKTINAELGIAQKLKLERSWMEYVDLSVTGFYSHMSDAIIRVPFAMPNGDSIYISDDRTLRIEANTNASTAYIVGVSSELKIQSTKGFSFNASINWLRGRSKLDGTESPLAHIPPIYGKVECQYEKSRWGIILNYTYNGKKKLEDFAPGSSDNEEYATPEGSLAWQTFNIYGHYSISDRLKLRIGAENLADIHYRPFSSGLSAAGRNLKVGIYGSF